MKLLIRKSRTDSDGCYQAGTVVDLDDEQAEILISKRWAEALPGEPEHAHRHAPWPAQGCTLDEAMRRTADPDLWAAWIDAKQALELVRTPIPAGPSAVLQTSPEIIRERRNIALAAHKHLVTEFRKNLTESRLASTGSRGSRAEQAAPINAAAWTALRVPDWKHSVTVERGTKLKIFDVRVWPILQGPDAAESVIDQSLAEIFRTFVVEDPEVRARAKRLMPRDLYSKIFDPRPDCVFAQLKWPLDPQPGPLVLERIAPRSFWEVDPFAKQISALAYIGDVLADRLRALSRLAVSGRAGARGTSAATGTGASIERLLWQHRGTWIDVDRGDLVLERDGKEIARWLGVVFERPGAFHVKPAGYDGVLPASITPQAASAAAERLIREEPRRRPPRPVADAIAAALKKHGLDQSPLGKTYAEIARLITGHMPKQPRSANEMDAHLKAVARHYHRMNRNSA